MKKPYIFGHRGAMGYCIENTIPCFKKAVEMSVGIETDLQLTKDNYLICFHDYFIKVNSKIYNIKDMNYEDLRKIKFKDKRTIPSLREVFSIFKENSNTLYYSFDIRDKYTGFEIIKLAKSFNILEKVIVTDKRLTTLKALRKVSKKLNLVYTLPINIDKINQSPLNSQKLKDLNILAINVKMGINVDNKFNEIINNNFKCYIWGVNLKDQMEKVLRLKLNDEIVSAIYTDFPDVLIKLRDKMQS